MNLAYPSLKRYVAVPEFHMIMIILVENNSNERIRRANKINIMQSQKPSLFPQQTLLLYAGVPLSNLKSSKYKLTPGSLIFTSLPCNTEFETPWTLLFT